MDSPNSSRKALWLAAIKLPIYSVAAIPIAVGTAVAFGETSIFNAGIFATFLASAIFIVIWLNLSNDVFDSETGIDINKAHSVVNLTGNKSLIFWLSNLFLGAGFLGIFAITLWQGDGTVLALIILCCVLGYSYQGPPFRLGYKGLGEIICFLTFGPLAIYAVYYSQTKSLSFTALAPSIIIGISTSIILFCSHFHQVEDDRVAGKISPLVRLGTARGVKILAGATASLYILSFLFFCYGIFSPWTLLIFASLPLGYQLVNYVRQYHDIPDKVSSCKFLAVNLHFCSGVLLALGFVLSQI